MRSKYNFLVVTGLVLGLNTLGLNQVMLTSWMTS